MRKERIEYTIRPDGTVEERVEGIAGPRCELVTEGFEESLGEVTERVYTAEYMLRPSGTPARVAKKERAREERVEE
jgi:hypothetical protein